MRILIYGQCGDYGSGAYCYCEALKKMGHDVSAFGPWIELDRYNRSLPFRVVRRALNGGVLPWDRSRHEEALRYEIDRTIPDVVLVLAGLLLDRELVQYAKKQGAWVALINHDDFFSAFRSNRSAIRDRALPCYDYIFPTKAFNVDELRSVNANIELLQFAYEPDIHKPPLESTSDGEQWGSDLVFIGSCYPERVRQLEHVITNIGAPIRLDIYGNGWKRVSKASPLQPHIKNRTLGPEDMAKAIFYAKVSLAFLCKENRDDHTQRSFEIPACRGVLLAERTNRHSKLFKEGLEAEFFESSDYDELVRKCKYLLGKAPHRERLRDAGYAAVVSGHHTYRDRLTRILELYRSGSIRAQVAAGVLQK